MIIFRTDANEYVATGHLMRCLTIAEECVLLGEQVCFVVSDESSLEMLNSYTYEYFVINDNWDKPDEDLEYSFLTEKFNVGDVLVIDSYYISNNYLNKMKEVFKICVFDDLFKEKLAASIIINYNAFYKIFEYKDRYKKEKCKLLLGTKYVPLRRQFYEETNKKKDLTSRFRIMLICGGGDREGLIYNTLKYVIEKDIRNFEKYEWLAVIGVYNPYESEIINLSQRYSNIILKKNIKNMAEEMGKCDLCITAASTVLYECCAMRLPTWFALTSDDQIYDVKEFSKNNMMIYLGDLRNNKQGLLKNISNNLKNKHNWRKQKRKMKKFVDCKGTKRLAKEICKLKN